jgi:hypothetical protein
MYGWLGRNAMTKPYFVEYMLTKIFNNDKKLKNEFCVGEK